MSETELEYTAYQNNFISPVYETTQANVNAIGGSINYKSSTIRFKDGLDVTDISGLELYPFKVGQTAQWATVATHINQPTAGVKHEYFCQATADSCQWIYRTEVCNIAERGCNFAKEPDVCDSYSRDWETRGDEQCALNVCGILSDCGYLKVTEITEIYSGTEIIETDLVRHSLPAQTTTVTVDNYSRDPKVQYGPGTTLSDDIAAGNYCYLLDACSDLVPRGGVLNTVLDLPDSFCIPIQSDAEYFSDMNLHCNVIMVSDTCKIAETIFKIDPYDLNFWDSFYTNTSLCGTGICNDLYSYIFSDGTWNVQFGSCIIEQGSELNVTETIVSDIIVDEVTETIAIPYINVCAYVSEYNFAHPKVIVTEYTTEKWISPVRISDIEDPVTKLTEQNPSSCCPGDGFLKWSSFTRETISDCLATILCTELLPGFPTQTLSEIQTCIYRLVTDVMPTDLLRCHERTALDNYLTNMINTPVAIGDIGNLRWLISDFRANKYKYFTPEFAGYCAAKEQCAAISNPIITEIVSE